MRAALTECETTDLNLSLIKDHDFQLPVTFKLVTMTKDLIANYERPIIKDSDFQLPKKLPMTKDPALS